MTQFINDRPKWIKVTDSEGRSYTVYYADPTCDIQAIINEMQAGDTIELAPGTYEESITVTKPVTLKGQGKSL